MNLIRRTDKVYITEEVYGIRSRPQHNFVTRVKNRFQKGRTAWSWSHNLDHYNGRQASWTGISAGTTSITPYVWLTPPWNCFSWCSLMEVAKLLSGLLHVSSISGVIEVVPPPSSVPFTCRALYPSWLTEQVRFDMFMSFYGIVSRITVQHFYPPFASYPKILVDSIL